MPTQHKTGSTLEKSLATKRITENEADSFNDEIVTSEGGRNRNLIIANLTREISQQIKGTPCELYPKDMRVHIPATYSYIYPDIVAICAEPKFKSDCDSTLLNPLLVIDVLSEATASYCRGKKFSGYRTIESFAEYLLIAQDRYEIEHYVRQINGQWLFLHTISPKDTIELTTIQCILAVEEIYDKVIIS